MESYINNECDIVGYPVASNDKSIPYTGVLIVSSVSHRVACIIYDKFINLCPTHVLGPVPHLENKHA